MCISPAILPDSLRNGWKWEQRMKTKLSTEERRIERHPSAYRPAPGNRRERIHGILERTRKTMNINIRIFEATLEELKRRSEREGLLYQTLISSILHEYVTNRLVDQEAFTKSIVLLRSNRYAWPNVVANRRAKEAKPTEARPVEPGVRPDRGRCRA